MTKDFFNIDTIFEPDGLKFTDLASIVSSFPSKLKAYCYQDETITDWEFDYAELGGGCKRSILRAKYSCTVCASVKSYNYGEVL